ncbi:unnamed protein product [Calicophoron daubneyi]|uniref:Carnitine O-palmitoyltransferase n=1 Tax=Calicophoron daubneyi TaxID=300641 RepID=A0AAV2T469_CALDB
MAEAHAAVAFTFTVSSDGLSFDFNKQALLAVGKSGIRAWQKRYMRFKNSIYNNIYPFHPMSWIYLSLGVFLADYFCRARGHGENHYSPILYIEKGLRFAGVSVCHRFFACALLSLLIFLCASFINRLLLRTLLSYTAWMYQPHGRPGLLVQLWAVMLKCLMSSHPRLYGYQYSLPKLPLPKLQHTMEKYLKSTQHLVPEQEYTELVRQAKEFEKGPGQKLQFFLWLKTWLTSNYVSDWWEEYVYLAGRDPIMANSNFYGMEWKITKPIQPTQAARGAMITYVLMDVRKSLVNEELPPVFINGTVPLCSWQYERVFNTTRIPYPQKDKILHLPDSNHIVVYHRGRYFRCPLVVNGSELSAAEFEFMFNHIISEDNSHPALGEEKLAAFTAGQRDAWATARSAYFSNGVNRASLDAIESAAFFLVFDHEYHDIDFDNTEDLSYLGKLLLTGNCYNRWFDKSFTAVIMPDGTYGVNAEHSWGDAPIGAHVNLLAISKEQLGIKNQLPGLYYIENGHCDGEVMTRILPSRLRWDMPEACLAAMEASLSVARELADAIDLVVVRFTDFGRDLIKKVKCSPDAFVQMALQLAYMKDRGSLALVYESSMTRCFREGRTETVRSCTAEAAAFVRSMLEENSPREERLAKFRTATERHQRLIREAISGKGVDRHLFALYVVSRFLHMDNPFLKKILSEPWRLSTSQTPTSQLEGLKIDPKHPDANRAYGGGFGPVAKDGYGVSYIFSMENCIFFHVSSRFDCSETSSKRFGDNIVDSMRQIRDLLDPKSPKSQIRTEG